MTDAEKRIREALAAGPTPGPWTVMPANAGEQCVARINAWESVPPNGVELAHDTIDAAFIAACNPAAIRELLAERDALAAENERKDELLQQLRQWSEAYPLDIFPEPDFARAHAVLQAAGMTLDAISASNMRHVITKVREMIDAARGKE